jgi:hypothetical protein
MLDKALSGEPAPGGLCRICGAPLQGSLRCPRCNAVHGEGFRCPHCRAVADVERRPDGTLRCKACGGPRLLLDDGRGRLSPGATAALLRARKGTVSAGLWKAVALVSGGIGLMALAATVAVLAIFEPGVLFGALGLALSSLPALAALGALLRSRELRRARERALREAELTAARELAEAAPGELVARDLARTLGVEETRAELLLAELSLDDVVDRRVTDSGELAYSARPRIRVDEATDAELEPESPEAARRERSSP